MSTTAKEQEKRYCRRKNTWCEYASYWGECRITACKYQYIASTSTDYTHTNGGTYIERREDE